MTWNNKSNTSLCDECFTVDRATTENITGIENLNLETDKRQSRKQVACEEEDFSLNKNKQLEEILTFYDYSLITQNGKGKLNNCDYEEFNMYWFDIPYLSKPNLFIQHGVANLTQVHHLIP